MKQNRSSYFIGLGIGTLLSPVLLSALQANVPEPQRWMVWAIGVVIVIGGLIWQKVESKR